MDNLKRKIRNGPCKLLPVATTTQIAICNSISAICDTSFIAIYFAQRTQAQLSFKVTNLSDELLSLHISNHLIQTLLILKRSPRRVIETNLGSRLIPKVMRSHHPMIDDVDKTSPYNIAGAVEFKNEFGVCEHFRMLAGIQLARPELLVLS
uniref:Uncharacterized protein n=1 Tax=Glossina austeni TaxID=7395 RepID=A0A1A9UWQ4_GLOAU